MHVHAWSGPANCNNDSVVPGTQDSVQLACIVQYTTAAYTQRWTASAQSNRNVGVKAYMTPVTAPSKAVRGRSGRARGTQQARLARASSSVHSQKNQLGHMRKVCPHQVRASTSQRNQAATMRCRSPDWQRTTAVAGGQVIARAGTDGSGQAVLATPSQRGCDILTANQLRVTAAPAVWLILLPGIPASPLPSSASSSVRRLFRHFLHTVGPSRVR